MFRACSPHTRAFFVFIFLFSAAFLFSKLNFYRDPGSAFFDESRAYTRDYSAYRQKQAEEFIEHVESSDQSLTKAGTEPKICLAMVTVNRDGVEYITNGIGSALEGVTKRERLHFYINIFFANTNPNVHPAWGRKWVEKLVDAAHTYNKSGVDFGKIQALEEEQNYSEKAIIDYTTALNQCYATGAQWIAMIEDDVLFADGWHAVTLSRVLEIKQRVRSGKARAEWLYMRMFNDERWTKWQSTTIGANNELWISLGIAVVICPLLVWYRDRSKMLRNYFSNQALAVVFFVAVPSFVILFFQAGRASVLPPAPGVVNQHFGCCSQGLVFPRERIPEVVEFLKGKIKGQIDLFLDDYSNKVGLDRYSLYPTQLQHIGIKSARNTTSKEAQAIWSMAFEYFKPRELKQQHESIVNKLF